MYLITNDCIKQYSYVSSNQECVVKAWKRYVFRKYSAAKSDGFPRCKDKFT
jgi:hypothetical protein